MNEAEEKHFVSRPDDRKSYRKAIGLESYEEFLPNAPKIREIIPVDWKEGAVRDDFMVQYVSVGALPGVLRDKLAVHKGIVSVVSQTLFLTNRSRRTREFSDDARTYVRRIGNLLMKLLLRGHAPLPTIEVEREALRVHGLLEKATDLAVEGVEVGWEFPGLNRRDIEVDTILSRLLEREYFHFEPSFYGQKDEHNTLIKSSSQIRFLSDWVPKNIGPQAGHWFTPEASLDMLLESRGHGSSGDRRVDFLFYHPGGDPLVIEIDGPEHDYAVSVDEGRDRDLGRIGLKVVRVKNSELERGTGPGLNEVANHCKKALSQLAQKQSRSSFFGKSDKSSKYAALIRDCALAAKVQFAVSRALELGRIRPDHTWDIELVGGNSVMGVGIFDLLTFLSSYDTLYGGVSTPDRCIVRSDSGFVVAWERDDIGGRDKVSPDDRDADHLCIGIESDASPYHRIAEDGHQCDVLIRPVFLPLKFSTEIWGDAPRTAITSNNFEEAESALTTFLRVIFRKQQFRPMQGQALFTALSQLDCIVLLPTGAGKSIIYQLAGLLMPGLTIVVDPLISLMDDQLEGLSGYGIEKAIRIASGDNTEKEQLARILRCVNRGEYFFVLLTPERLQTPRFRTSLTALAENVPVNLAVIDEAHCISEWGHDFRPAYLHLADNLRKFCKKPNEQPPPILALTGTASRAVLRDMVIDLKIDSNRTDALIRPESFDRKELIFEVVYTYPSDEPLAKLEGVLNVLPSKFGIPRAEFYRSAGRRTNAGIIFVPTVTAKSLGLDDAYVLAMRVTKAKVARYSGKPPSSEDPNRWNEIKRENAREFKTNEKPVLVSTKAFGMGIDKPNIRYTIHFGMPSSLENFYQEAGRAGRDRRQARCIVIFFENSPERTDALLNSSIDFSELRSRHEKEDNWDSNDDITRALFFHLKGFQGVEKEIADLESLLQHLGDLSSDHREKLGFDNKNKVDKERALYRLLRIGVVSDYEVDWGSRKFTVTIPKFNLERCKEVTLDYIAAAQPAKAAVFARRLEDIKEDNPSKNALKLGDLLAKFVYETIERSRRRMIHEAVLLARHGKSDEVIRVRLLDYLQEGLGATQISMLLEKEVIDLTEWQALAEKVQTGMDAGELRGFCIRALESYPDHPGLLMIRAVAESMCPVHEESTVMLDLSAAIYKGVVEYEIPSEHMAEALKNLFDFSRTRATNLGFPLIYASLEASATDPRLSFLRSLILPRALEIADPKIRILVAAEMVTDIAKQLEKLAPRIQTDSKILDTFTFKKGKQHEHHG